MTTRSDRRAVLPPPVVGFGTLALDTVEVPAGRATGVVGGSAAYFAAAASLIGPVGVLGVVGSDFPWQSLEALEGRGVDLSGVERREGPSMRWHARVWGDLESRVTLEVDRGVSARGAPMVPPDWVGAPALFLGSTDPELQRAVLEGVSPSGLIALDTMAHWIEERPGALVPLVRRCHVLLVNEGEAASLAARWAPRSSGAGLRRMADGLLSLGPDWVVIKRGRRGAEAFARHGELHVSAAPATPKDPTGAGDAFAGGLVARLAQAATLDPVAMDEALSHGSAAAALALEAFGITALLRAGPEELARRVADLRRRGRS